MGGWTLGQDSSSSTVMDCCGHSLNLRTGCCLRYNGFWVTCFANAVRLCHRTDDQPEPFAAVRVFRGFSRHSLSTQPRLTLSLPSPALQPLTLVPTSCPRSEQMPCNSKPCNILTCSAWSCRLVSNTTASKTPVTGKGPGKTQLCYTNHNSTYIHHCSREGFIDSGIHFDIAFPTSFYSHSVKYSLSLKRLVKIFLFKKNILKMYVV